MLTLKKNVMKYKDPQTNEMKDIGAIIGELSGENGKDGEDGFSPIAKVEETENGATITIVDKDGETTVDIKNGHDGSDGNNGTDGIGITKSEIDENGNLVITYSDETTTTLGKVVGENGKDGEDGQDGEKGQDGKSAYEYAQDGGFIGTEEEFATKLAKDTGGENINVDAELKSYFNTLKPTVVVNINAKGGNATPNDSFTTLCTDGINSIPNDVYAAEDLPMQTTLTATYSASEPNGITLGYNDVGADGYLIIRKENEEPSSSDDGVVVYNGEYMSGYVDNDVILNNTYYYRIFPYNSKKQYQSLRINSVVRCDYIDRSGQKQIKDLAIDDAVALGQYKGSVFIWKVVDNGDDSGKIFAAEQNCGNLQFDALENATDNPNPITARKSNGNNRWAYSNVRQFLNSDAIAGEWYTPQHEYDVAPSYKTSAGFLNAFTDAEKNTIVVRTNKCILDKNDGGGTETFQDKIWLPSSYEVGKEITVAGYKFEKYDATSASTTYQANWWLRTIQNATSTAETACTVRCVYSGGSLGSYYANNISYGAVRPFCQLRNDTWLTWSDAQVAYVLADDSQRTWAA